MSSAPWSRWAGAMTTSSTRRGSTPAASASGMWATTSCFAPNHAGPTRPKAIAGKVRPSAPGSWTGRTTGPAAEAGPQRFRRGMLHRNRGRPGSCRCPPEPPCPADAALGCIRCLLGGLAHRRGRGCFLPGRLCRRPVSGRCGHADRQRALGFALGRMEGPAGSWIANVGDPSSGKSPALIRSRHPEYP